MNPQDVKTNADRLRVRDDYLAILRQQEANLQKTANAMSVMATTGQPPVAPSDMRSISEKLVDIERLKPMFRKQLSSLMDGREASNVMNELSNEEIQFAVTIFGEIYNELKGKYPLGVPAPIFVEFMRRFFRDYNKSVGFLPKSKEERDALSDVNALEGTAQYLRAQQDQLEREIEDTGLAQDMRNRDSREIIAENQMRGKYNEAFSIASPNEIAETATIITGNSRPKSLTIAKRILGFDKLTPEEIFKYTNPSKTELVLYLSYDYFRNFGERFSRRESTELNKLDMNELQDLFIQARGGNNIWGEEELVEDIPQDPVENVMFDMVGEVERRSTRGDVESVMEGMLGQLESGFGSASLGANPTAAEVTEAVRRGRKPKYASQAEAAAAKRLQTTESKQRTQLRQDIENQLDRDIRLLEVELTQNFKLGNIGRSEFEDRMSYVKRNKLAELEKRFREAGVNVRSYKSVSSKIPAFSGAAEYQGLAAVEQPAASSSSEVTISVPDRFTLSADAFEDLNYLSKIDLMDALTRTDLFVTLDRDLQRSVRNAIEDATGGPKQDQALRFLNDAFRRIRGTTIRDITGMGFMSKVKATATGAAKHTKNLIIGRGLKPKKDFSEKVDFSVSTLPANKSYVPFGKYVLNQRRLNENKLMVRTVKGGAISGIPTLAISPVLGGIIKKMVGGALPSYNEMSGLSEDEQNTLYKIFKMSEVDNADLLPAPNKTKEESEMNRFQILKGQITAGNDSTELIKEFKVMLLKFIHNGKVPKGQGMEIIFDLMAMGH